VVNVPERLQAVRYTEGRGMSQRRAPTESLVATYRREVLDAELFHSLLEAHVMNKRWQRLYNE